MFLLVGFNKVFSILDHLPHKLPSRTSSYASNQNSLPRKSEILEVKVDDSEGRSEVVKMNDR